MCASAEVNTPRDEWQGEDGQCLTLIGNPEKAENIRRLALAMLGRYDETVGCVTFPYLGSPYDVAGNEVHAGIDFRANGVAVRAAEAGTVVERALDPAAGRSTLIIENNGRTRKTLYLHMSSIDVQQGEYVLAGQKVGTAGSVGADHPHLHFEAWSTSSPLYCARDRAISGSACSESGSCDLHSIRKYTSNPEARDPVPGQHTTAEDNESVGLVRRAGDLRRGRAAQGRPHSVGCAEGAR